MNGSDSPAGPPYHLTLAADEAQAAASAVRLMIADAAHEPRIRQLARDVLASLERPPDERSRVAVTLAPAEMKIAHTATKLLLDDLQREQAAERALLRAVLDKLPDEHTMRAIQIG